MSTTSTIGTATRNYSTITAWHAAFANGGWIGECYNDSEFNETPSIAGTSALNYEILRPATGQSAFDNSANPLKYDVTKGVGLKNAAAYGQVLTIGSYVTVERMQIRNTAQGRALGWVTSKTGIVVNRNLLQMDAGGGNVLNIQSGGSITNSVVIVNHTTGRALTAEYVTGLIFANNTFVSPSDKSNASAALDVKNLTATITNCAFFGFSGGVTTGTGSTLTGGNNATDQASAPGSSGNLLSQTYANQFVGVTAATMNFTLKSGNTIGAGKGATDTTDIPAAVDIFNTARTAGQWSIGAFQDSTAVVTAFKSTLMMMGIG